MKHEFCFARKTIHLKQYNCSELPQLKIIKKIWKMPWDIRNDNTKIFHILLFDDNIFHETVRNMAQYWRRFIWLKITYCYLIYDKFRYNLVHKKFDDNSTITECFCLFVMFLIFFNQPHCKKFQKSALIWQIHIKSI